MVNSHHKQQKLVLSHAASLYTSAGTMIGLLQKLRPRICPFTDLLPLFPKQCRVLDIGCGSGLLLGLLSACGKIDTGLGFDSSHTAIATAETMRGTLSDDQKSKLQFHQVDVEEKWPTADINVVSMIDVLHHCPPSVQADVIKMAAAAVPPDGLFIYKDMARRPLLHACANRLHDLVMAKQWIHYCDIKLVEETAQSCGLQLEDRFDKKMYWYAHECRVFRRPLTEA